MQKLYFPGAKTVRFTPFAQIGEGQDGAIWGDRLFKMDPRGNCRVYPLGASEPETTFALDRLDLIVPHSNAVSFGTQRLEPADEFPLLYTNVYNNYAAAPERHEGECLVYRLWREGGRFVTKLVQVIRVGFVDTPRWRSANGSDVRPYGNFVIDAQQNALVAFVMRDEDCCTRFFALDLPDAAAGEPDENGVRVVTLTEENVRAQFDTPYMRYMQGAACHEGYVYSVEGFTRHAENPAMLRVIDLRSRREVLTVNLVEHDLPLEPEYIEVFGGSVYYAARDGALFTLTFEE